MRLTTRPEIKKRRPKGTITAAAAIAMAKQQEREGYGKFRVRKMD